MDSKPIITYAGDEKLFDSLKINLADSLPQESIEWKRSHMRNPKSVHVTANFMPFSEEKLLHKGTKKLLGQAFFHTYWVECHDVDHYKQSAKENINTWLSKLKSKKVYDWLIIVIDHTESKKANKTKLLPRTTVLDKIKSDFPSQNSQRCISLLDPSRNDSRAAESWHSLLHRIRELILQAYSRHLGHFEEFMRTQRERRNEHGWNFQDFFFLQEELAFVLEMLGLYDEALVQYDELDALFTQFVINSNVGDMPDWLNTYSNPCNLWSGVCLHREKSAKLREEMKKGNACLLDLRNYLFARQCSLLLLLCRPWEIAQRTLPFLHNCINELKILEVSMPSGSIACWVFLSCFEVLCTCEKFSDTSQIKEYSLYCAGLWAYAREKLHQLGVLCGLMPDLKANSEKLHIVVNLLAGMGEDPYLEIGTQSPHAKLREALSSKESFLKHYLELSELTMGTFKHNRRIRTARLIGKDLADLYMKMGQPQKAIVFLTDLLKTYREENWKELIIDIQQKLLECYLAMNDIPRYLKTCIRLAATTCFGLDKRKDYFQAIISSSEKLDSGPLILKTEKIFFAYGFKIETSQFPIISNSDISIQFNIYSNLPNEIICRNVKLIIKKQSSSSLDKAKHANSLNISPKMDVRNSLNPLFSSKSGEIDVLFRETVSQQFLVQPQLVISSNFQDGSQNYSVICKNTHQVLQRRDSQGFHKDDITEDDKGLCFKSYMIKLQPDKNVVSIPLKVQEPGLYDFHHLWLEWGNIHFALTSISPVFSFTISEEMPTVSLKSEHGDLLAGIEQKLELKIYSGSYCFSNNDILHLKASRGLKLKSCDNQELKWLEEIDIILPEMKPFTTFTIIVCALSLFGPQKNTNAIEHWITLHLPWSSNSQRILLHFLPPFLVTHKLHTCNIRKYMQVIIQGLTTQQFVFQNTKLTSSNKEEMLLKQLNSAQSMVVNANQRASYLWEIEIEEADHLPLNFQFSCDYHLENEDYVEPYHYNFEFRLKNYQTLYAVRARVEPPKGSEFCRAGIICFMHIIINQINISAFTSLMYEIVADQAMWAVCGRTAGVVNIDESGKHNVVLEVMPLISGFLPLPTVRLSKYIPADHRKSISKDSTQLKENSNYNVARLEPFDPGQIYSCNRATQVNVLPASNASSLDIST